MRAARVSAVAAGRGEHTRCISGAGSAAARAASDGERESYIFAATVGQVFGTLLSSSPAFERLGRALDRVSL